MSAAMGSNTDTVYVELLDEGTFVLRPARGERISKRVYKLLLSEDYDPELENWRFTPGSTVECEWESHGGERLLVAKRTHSAGKSPSAS